MRHLPILPLLHSALFTNTTELKMPPGYPRYSVGFAFWFLRFFLGEDKYVLAKYKVCLCAWK